MTMTAKAALRGKPFFPLSWGGRLPPAQVREIQPQGEVCSKKGKQVKGNESKRAFICFHLFFGIGTFQRVMGNSNRKIPLRLNSRQRLWAWAFVTRVPQLHLAPPPDPPAGLSSTSRKMISQGSVLESVARSL